MYKRALLPALCILLLCGCQKPAPDKYAALDQSGMLSATIDTLKSDKVTEMEISQLTKLKQAGASDDTCLALYKAAHDHGHDFSSGDSAVELSRAGYSEAQILQMAQSDQIDVLSDDAVTLKLIGLSNPTVQEIMSRRIQGLPTLTSAQIGELKNVGLNERQILEIIDKGMSSDEADKMIAQREAARNHAHTDFTRQSRRR